MGKIFYLMGKSASGKDSIYERLLENKGLSLSRIVLYTTRPIREGERAGSTYNFVDEDRYREYEEKNLLIESRFYNTVQGTWRYFTVDDGQIDPEEGNYLGIGTLTSYKRLKEYFGEAVVCPIYVEVEDGERLIRAVHREQQQEQANYKEICRRFLADCDDFSEENLEDAGISIRFNNDKLQECMARIEKYIASMI